MSKILFRGISPGIMVERVHRKNAFFMPAVHFHNEYEIYYLYNGNRRYVIDNKYYDLVKGDLVFINKQVAHRTLSSPTPSHERLLIEFHEEPFSAFLFSLFGLSLSDFFSVHCGIIHLDEDGQSRAEQLFCNIQKEFEFSAFSYENAVMMHIAELLLWIHRTRFNKRSRAESLLTTSPQTEKNRIAKEVLAYITSPEGRFTSLEELSAKFHLSKSYLSHIFKDLTGFTVHESLNIHRIKYSQNLLVNTNESIEKIAYDSGFQSLTYFERVFRKHTDTSPLKYRKRIHQIIQNTRNPLISE